MSVTSGKQDFAMNAVFCIEMHSGITDPMIDYMAHIFHEPENSLPVNNRMIISQLADDLEYVRESSENLWGDVAQKQSHATKDDRCVPSTTRAREELGLRCKIPLQEAICRTYNRFSAKQGGSPAVRTRGSHA
jgi:hypothetical protein